MPVKTEELVINILREVRCKLLVQPYFSNFCYCLHLKKDRVRLMILYDIFNMHPNTDKSPH